MIKLKENTRHPLWRRPKHHLDCNEATEHVHWIELFYDLAHVLAIFVLSHFASHHYGVMGFFAFVALFSVMWMAWLDTTWFNSLYVSTDIYHRLYMIGLIFTVVLSTVAIESIEHSQSWTVFAIAYAANRFIVARLYWRARNIADSSQALPTEMARNYTLVGVIYLISAFLPQPLSYYVFGGAFFLSLVWYGVPNISPLRLTRNRPRLGHLAERFGLFMIIVSGEGLAKLTLAIAEKGVYKMSIDMFVYSLIGALSMFIVCWVYYDFAGYAKPKNDKPFTLYQWFVSHMLLMFGVVMIAVSLFGQVSVSFFEPYPTKYAFFGCVGLVLYLLALMWLRNINEYSLAHRFKSLQLQTFGIVMAVFALLASSFVPSIITNLLWATALFSQVFVSLWLAIRALQKAGDL